MALTQLAPPMETKVKNCADGKTGCFCKNWTRSNIIKEWVSILVKNSGLCAVNKRSYSNKLQHGATKGLLEMENVIYYQGCFWVLPQPITKKEEKQKLKQAQFYHRKALSILFFFFTKISHCSSFSSLTPLIHIQNNIFGNIYFLPDPWK